MTTLQLAIDPFGYFLPWRDSSSVRVVVNPKAQKVRPFLGAFYGFFFRIFASILSFAITSGVTIAMHYALHSVFRQAGVEPKFFGMIPIESPVSILFFLNIVLFVVSILRAITEILKTLWSTSKANVDSSNQSVASL